MVTKVKKEKESLRELDLKELNKKLNNLREELRSIKFKVEGGKAGNVKQSLLLRKKIARILTEINKRNK